MNNKIFFVLSIVFAVSCNNHSDNNNTANTGPADDSAPVNMNYSVVNAYPHDTTSFTEGLLFHDGKLYESTGHTDNYPSSRSLFGIVDSNAGNIQTKVEIDKNKYFGEGIVFLKGKIYQLTLENKIGFIYDAKTYKKIGEFPLPSEQGWGMTTDGNYLIISDGSSNIRYLDPDTFKLLKILGVTDNNGPVGNLNELEMIDGYLYANQWQTNYILKIDPSSGKIVGKLDLTSLANEAKNKYPGSAEMNGIAYDSSSKKIYVTGKMWPNIYEIKFSH